MKSSIDRMPALALWLGENPDSPWLQAEKACCQKLLGPVLAGHVVQFDLNIRTPNLVPASPAVFRHRFQASGDGGLNGPCDACFEQLPLLPNSVQLLVSHHCHEIAEDLDAMIAEWSRVLTVNGTLVIVAFNAIGRDCESPLTGISRLRPGQLAKVLGKFDLVAHRVRAVTQAGHWPDRALQRVGKLSRHAERWAAGLAVGYVLSARKIDNGGLNLDLNRIGFKRTRARVHSAAGYSFEEAEEQGN